MTAKPLKKDATYDDLHFGSDVLVPDRAGWRRERLPHVPSVPHLTLASDWVCEVLSPVTETLDRGKKLRIYARERVSHAWLVNPTLRTLEVRSLDSETFTLTESHEGSARIRAVPFHAIDLDLGALWP